MGVKPPYPTTYDKLINKYRDKIPLSFIRVLIAYESGYNPNSDHGLAVQKKTGKYSEGAAKGLMQVVQSVRKDYNETHGKNYQYKDLFNPDVNIAMGCFTLNRIVSSYAKFHPNSLATDWSDRRWVELLIFGWNAGYSERGGVGKVVGAMERAGIPKEKVTIENVRLAAQKAGAAPYLWDEEHNSEGKVKWAKALAQSFYKEKALSQKEGVC